MLSLQIYICAFYSVLKVSKDKWDKLPICKGLLIFQLCMHVLIVCNASLQCLLSVFVVTLACVQH